jgi:hypothetical protein
MWHSRFYGTYFLVEFLFLSWVVVHFLILFSVVVESSVEQVLPDSLFASPKNSAGDHTTAGDLNESENNSSTSANSATCMASQ